MGNRKDNERTIMKLIKETCELEKFYMDYDAQDKCIKIYYLTDEKIVDEAITDPLFNCYKISPILNSDNLLGVNVDQVDCDGFTLYELSLEEATLLGDVFK